MEVNNVAQHRDRRVPEGRGDHHHLGPEMEKLEARYWRAKEPSFLLRKPIESNVQRKWVGAKGTSLGDPCRCINSAESVAPLFR